MTEAGNKRFDNLCNVLHKVDDEKLRYALVENFYEVTEDYRKMPLHRIL